MILFHFLAVVVSILNTPSGPWPTMPGAPPITFNPPQFAQVVSGPLLYLHTHALKMGQGCRFQSNRLAVPAGVYFEVNLRNVQGGDTVAKLRFPDPKANAWVQHRQLILARGLAEDIFTEPRMGGDNIPAPGERPEVVRFWDQTPTPPEIPRTLLVKPEYEVREGTLRPSERSWNLARAYSRYLCRTHGTMSAEIIRHTRDPIPPDVLLHSDPGDNVPEEIIASFGEINEP
jgi:hypothetical protein